MMPSVTPKATATAASCQRRCRNTARSVRASPAPPMAAIIMAEVHSRSPVTPAAGTSVKSLPATPAPTCTDTIPAATSADGGTRPSRPPPAPGPAAPRALSPSLPPLIVRPPDALPRGLRAAPSSGSRAAASLPAEHTRRDRDAANGPGGQHHEIAGRQPATQLQYRAQAVGQRAGRQQRQHLLRAVVEIRQREDHAAE